MIATIARLLLPLSAIAFASTAAAGDMAITAAKIDPLPVFAAPNDAMPLRTVPVTGLPWTVKEVKSEFFRVSIDGADVWVDSMKVRASQKIVAHCGLAQPPGTAMAGELGASSSRCTK